MVTRHVHKVYDSGEFVGVVPNVVSDFYYSQDIFTAAAEYTFTISMSSDIAAETPEVIETEAGVPMLTEQGSELTMEYAYNIVGADDSLIQTMRTVEVYEYSDFNPNGVLVYSGIITRWRSRLSESSDVVVTCISDGFTLGNYVVSSAEATNTTQLTDDDTSYETYEVPY